MGHSLPWHHQSTKTKSRTEKLLCLHGVVGATLQKRHLLFPTQASFRHPCTFPHHCSHDRRTGW